MAIDSLVDVIAMLGNECTDQEEVFDQDETFAPGSDDEFEEMDGVFEGDDPGEWDDPDLGEGDEANNLGEGEEEGEHGKK